MSQAIAPLDAWIVPRTASDIFNTLKNVEHEQSEDRIAFAIAGALFIASLKAGVYQSARPGGIDRQVLFFKFVESLDPKRRLSKTLINLSGRFLNYVAGWRPTLQHGRPKVSVMEPVRWVVEAVERASCLDDTAQQRMTRALLKVRDASYLYTTYSYEWRTRLKDVDDILWPIEQRAVESEEAPTSEEEEVRRNGE